jgi:hypothetical protein
MLLNVSSVPSTAIHDQAVSAELTVGGIFHA